MLGASVLGFLLYPAVISCMERKILADRRIRRSTGRGNLCFCDLAGIPLMARFWRRAASALF